MLVFHISASLAFHFGFIGGEVPPEISAEIRQYVLRPCDRAMRAGIRGNGEESAFGERAMSPYEEEAIYEPMERWHWLSILEADAETFEERMAIYEQEIEICLQVIEEKTR